MVARLKQGNGRAFQRTIYNRYLYSMGDLFSFGFRGEYGSKAEIGQWASFSENILQLISLFNGRPFHVADGWNMRDMSC